MTKKRLLLIASLALAVVVALWVPALLLPRDSITKANFDRIKKGMTRPEVESIFGPERTVLAPCGRDVADLWRDNQGDRNAYVFFDKNGSVLSTSWTEASMFDKIRRVLQLR